MHTLAHRIELLPTGEQASRFERAAGCARFAYNWALAECHRVRAETGKNPKISDLKRQFNALKRGEFPWIYESPKDANQQPFAHLQRAWSRFWEGVKEGKIPVWSRAQKRALLAQGVKHSAMSFAPTFKRRKDGASFYVSNDKFKISGKTVRLPLVGDVPMTEELRFEGKILSGTVSKHGGRWFLSVQVEMGARDYFRFRSEDGVVGVDLGVKDTAVLSTGERLTGPKPYRAAQRRLAIRQRRVSRKQEVQLEKMGLKGKPIPKGTKIPRSNNQKRAEEQVSRIHARVRNVRADFQHKFTTRLCGENQAIGIEDLNVTGILRNRKLARAVSDIGMGEIRRQLEYKAARYGTRIVVIDRWYPSSKTCSECDWEKADLTLREREWVCEGCGVIHDRDHNAAKNLRRKVFEIFPELLPGGYPESHASPETSGLVETSGQETKNASSSDSGSLLNTV